MTISNPNPPIFEAPGLPDEWAAIIENLYARHAQRLTHAATQGLEYEKLLEQKKLAEIKSSARRTHSLWVSVEVRDQKLPVLNDWFNRFKRAFHELIVIYVNQLAGKQTDINFSLSTSVQELATLVDKQRQRIAALEERVASLELKIKAEEATAPPTSERTA